MNPFTRHTGLVAALNRANVDTDAIIPKQFLKSIYRTGYGPNAFFDWRYNADGALNMDFELNHPRFKGRSILVSRNNFGCGSSREHAVWALVQDGYRAVIAPRKELRGQRMPGFADIFSINASKNGLLLIEVSEEAVSRIFELVDTHKGLQATIDLSEQRVEVHAPEPMVLTFSVEAGVKEQLIKGLDDIDLTLLHEAEITRFEQTHNPMLPG
jgi:3-isopropylmalate/(R)-2-methylmalate dehydratase small subunit